MEGSVRNSTALTVTKRTLYSAVRFEGVKECSGIERSVVNTVTNGITAPQAVALKRVLEGLVKDLEGFQHAEKTAGVIGAIRSWIELTSGAPLPENSRRRWNIDQKTEKAKAGGSAQSTKRADSRAEYQTWRAARELAAKEAAELAGGGV